MCVCVCVYIRGIIVLDMDNEIQIKGSICLHACMYVGHCQEVWAFDHVTSVMRLCGYVTYVSVCGYVPYVYVCIHLYAFSVLCAKHTQKHAGVW